MNQGSFMNYQDMPQIQPNQKAKGQSEMDDLLKYRIAYPEIYYKCQPFVMMACDQIEAYSTEMPTQETIERMADNIYDDVRQMYPDMAEYVKSSNDDAAVPAQGFMSFDRDQDRNMFGRRFRRRGPFRDFLEFLLLSELFRRRRRFY